MIVIITLFGFFILGNQESNNDPIKIIENKYDIDLKRFNCSVELFDQQISPDGDGYCKITLNIHNIPDNIDAYLKSKKMKLMPVIIEPFVMLPLAFTLSRYEDSKGGYYLYNVKGSFLDNFDFLMFDLENKKIIYLYSSI